MGQTLYSNGLKRRTTLFLLLVLTSFLWTCKKADDTNPQQPNTNFELGFIEAPASVYAAIPNAPAPAPGGVLPSSFLLEIPSTPFNQAQQGSCVSCATAMAKSILDHVKKGTAYPSNGIIYSPSYIFNQVHLDPTNCSVGSYVYTNLELLKSQGVCRLSEMAYNPSNCTTLPTSNQRTLAAPNKINHYFKLDPITINWIKEFIHVGHAVIVAFHVDDFFNASTPTSNTVWTQFGSVSRGLHAALLYGWDDSKNAFKMLNSWGSGWGNNGTIWVNYNFVQNGASALYGRIFREAYILQNPATSINTPVADFDANGSSTSINVGQQITFRDLSTNNPTSWSWSFPGGTPSSSTSQNPTVTYNTAGTYNVTLTATNSVGSNSKTRTSYITVTSSPTWSCGQPFTDTRDGRTYATINIGGQCWLAENFKYASASSVIYNNDAANLNTYGRLYNWNDALSVAPAGWRLPTDNDWIQLEQYLGMTSTAAYQIGYRGTDQGTKMKVGGSSAFNLVLGGHRNTLGGFAELGLTGNYWTSTEYAVDAAYSRSVYNNNSQVGRQGGMKAANLSIRLIRN